MLENEGGSEIVRFTEAIRKVSFMVRFRSAVWMNPLHGRMLLRDLNNLTLCGIDGSVIVNTTDDIRSEGIGLACKKI